MSSRGKKREAGAPKSLAEVKGRMEAQIQQVEERLGAGEKRVKNLSLAFSNQVFKKAQEAFESCEAINQQSDEMRGRAAEDHAGSRKALGAARKAAAKRAAQTARAAAELQALQEEAAGVFAALRSKMIPLPRKTPSASSLKRARAGQEGAAGSTKRKSVHFQQQQQRRAAA